jgi:hypothetical protein
MEKEYTIATGWKILYGVISTCLIGVSVFLFTKHGPQTGLLFILMPAWLIIAACAMMFNVFKSKVVVSDYSIITTSIRGTKEIINTDVKGFRVGEKAIFIEPVPDGYRKLIIPDYRTIGNKDELLNWLKTHFTNLDSTEKSQMQEVLLSDPDLGFTKEDRLIKYDNARKATLLFNMGGPAVFIIMVLFRTSIPLLSILLAIYPFIGILIMQFNRGLVTLFAKKNSPYSYVLFGMLVPVVLLIILSTINYKVLNYNNFWLPFISISALMFIALYYGIKASKAAFQNQVIFAALIALCYGYGSIIQVNWVFDKSITQLFVTSVADKYITHGRSNSYHLLIVDWANHNRRKNVTVVSSFYKSAEVGSNVDVHLRQGLLNIPYYFISK